MMGEGRQDEMDEQRKEEGRRVYETSRATSKGVES